MATSLKCHRMASHFWAATDSRAILPGQGENMGEKRCFSSSKKSWSPLKKNEVASRAYLLIELLCGRRLRSRALMSQAGLTIKHGGISALVIAHGYGKKENLFTGKSFASGPFSIAMWHDQTVTIQLTRAKLLVPFWQYTGSAESHFDPLTHPKWVMKARQQSKWTTIQMCLFKPSRYPHNPLSLCQHVYMFSCQVYPHCIPHFLCWMSSFSRQNQHLFPGFRATRIRGQRW